MKKTICLNMIVKNEAHIIEETLNNIYKYIDYWVICDTGSTDNTKEIITKFFKEKNIKGKIFDSEWKNFAYNRSYAFEKAYNKTDYVWVIDADDIVVGDFKLPNNMVLDGYELKYGSKDLEYIRMQIFNNKLKWRYRGVLHEYPECIDKKDFTRTIIEGDYYIDSRRLGDRSKDPLKYQKDAEVLIKAIEENEDPELNGRYYFYAAQSYKDFKNYENSIKYYNKRIEYGGWIEELYISYMEIGLSMIRLKYDKKEISDTFLNGFKIIPNRTECMYYLCYYYFNNDDLENAYKIGKILLNIKPKKYMLFVRESYTKWERYKLVYNIYDNILDKNIIIKNISNEKIKEDKDKLFISIMENPDYPEQQKKLLFLKGITELDDYEFYPNKDTYGHDVGYFPDKTIEELKDICEIYDNAVGFNTYGYIKYLINDELISLDNKYYKNDGLFVKKKEKIQDILNIPEEKMKDKLQSILSSHLNLSNKYDLYNYYNNELVNKITEHVNTVIDKKITFSITTCKRFDLFEKTINSFINCCNDILLIDEYIGIDDNSTEEDRNKMKNLYPFIKWSFKDESLKGHISSMNLIINLVDTEYLLHLEDDWLFYEKFDYIQTSLDILNQTKILNIDNIPDYFNLSRKTINQVLFNKNYSELEEHYIVGGYLCKTDNNNEYIIHEHFHVNTNEHKLTIEKYNNASNCIYWPHFSFRPSIIRTSVFKQLGKFNDKSSFFERDYAERYCNANFISCFLNKVSCKHIGKLTSEKGNNAYTLNNVYQFSINKMNNYIYKCVNLERRKDRKENMKKIFNDNLIINYEFYNAIDGLTLELNLDIYNLFKDNDFGSRKSFIGCALSHYNIWKELLNSDYNYYIVFEDDIRLTTNFRIKLNKILSEINSNLDKYDYLLLGYTQYTINRNLYKNIYENDKEDISICILNKNLYIGGTFSYIITKSGANKILDYIKHNSIKHGIDYLINIIPELNIYETQPSLVFSDWAEPGILNIDSDIQLDYNSFNFDDFDKQNNWILIENFDYCGSDIINYHLSINDVKNIANKNNRCIAFNTLGFLKYNINLDNLKTSPYFSNNDGIYVRKDIIEAYQIQDDKIRIKMICNWTDSKSLCDEWNNMTKGDYTWNNINFTWEDYNINYYIIINKPCDNSFYIPEKTIIFQMEPWCYDDNLHWGVKTWGEWSEPDSNKFLQVRNHKNYHNNVFWQLKQTWTEFKNNKIIKDVNKCNKISTICSSKYFDPGHIKRIDFLKFIEEKNDPDVIIDIYNHDNTHNFKNYKGPHPIGNKDIGITPYKYYFMAENNIEYNFMTEKIWEPLLTESLCFYWGCPNLADYINPEAYVELDLNDFEKSFNIIKDAINDNLWEQKLDVIRTEKQKVLDYYGFCPTVERIINQDIEENNILYNKYFNNYNNRKFDNVCFIHSCTINNNISILEKLINIIKESNLINELDIIVINNIGNKIDNNFNNNKIYIINYSEDISLFEIPTINLIYSFSYYHSNVKLLYLHTKGISYNDSYIKQNIIDWTDMMLYFLITEYKNCIYLLNFYNTAGCNYSKEPKYHYSGNFWWANTDYIKTLYKIKSGIRHDAEWWILSNNPKYYILHNSNINHYESNYPSNNYNIEHKLSDIQNKLIINYGTFNEELPEQNMITKYIKGHEKILEIGGNIGRSSMIIASIINSFNNDNLVTLECDKEMVEKLTYNRDSNNLKFHIEPTALSLKKLIQHDIVTKVSDTLIDGYKYVDIISLQELNNKYNISVDTLVLDCEGAFYHILKDMPDILNNINLIIMENDYQTIEEKNYVDKILMENNFRVDYCQSGGWGHCQNCFFEVWIKI